MFLFFFFFKQKTAYEMRISDWSSDVCSSDLNSYDAIVLDLMLPRMDGVAVCRKLRDEAKKATPVLMLTARDTLQDKVSGLEAEIGRASCRERVCQYV